MGKEGGRGGREEREPSCLRDGKMLTRLIENMLIRACRSTESLRKKGRKIYIV